MKARRLLVTTFALGMFFAMGALAPTMAQTLVSSSLDDAIKHLTDVCSNKKKLDEFERGSCAYRAIESAGRLPDVAKLDTTAEKKCGISKANKTIKSIPNCLTALGKLQEAPSAQQSPNPTADTWTGAASAAAPAEKPGATAAAASSPKPLDAQGAVPAFRPPNPAQGSAQSDASSPSGLVVFAVGLSILATLLGAIALWFAARGKGGPLHQKPELPSDLETRLAKLEHKVRSLVAGAENQRTSSPSRNPTPALTPREPARSASSFGEPPPPIRHPSAPVATRAPQISERDLNQRLLKAIEVLAADGSSITEANASTRIIGAVSDVLAKQALQGKDVEFRFFTASGGTGSVNAELIGWCYDGGGRWQLIPHPSSGRVGQFNNWFSTSDYGIHPVLAETPAIGSLGTDGRLVPEQLGVLR